MYAGRRIALEIKEALAKKRFQDVVA